MYRPYLAAEVEIIDRTSRRACKCREKERFRLDGKPLSLMLVDGLRTTYGGLTPSWENSDFAGVPP
jgi:hypothetical protein